jgi:uncharacterized protein DUF6932
MLPALHHDGNLPEGIHLATEDEVFARFATPSARQQWLGEQLRSLLPSRNRQASLPGCFYGVVLSPAKRSPTIWMWLVMDTGFTVEAVSAQAQIVFDHVQARLRFHADIFWTTAALDPQVLHLWLDTYQTGKDFTRRGMVEVIVA